MRSLLILLSVAAIMSLGFWAYRENYRTQGELAEVRALQGEIGQLKESLGMLRAEWAYLNRPDRLRELAEINFGRLGLLPLEPRQFGTVSEVAYPQIGLGPITDPIDTVALNGEGE
ncbi:MAG: cell division protein FtsL [Rhodobacteraceae bacterium]|nr:cell division protein FtsL [Paracoccaceae bacterium]